MEKIAVLAPMPKARATIAAIAKPEFFENICNECFVSLQKLPMYSLHAGSLLVVSANSAFSSSLWICRICPTPYCHQLIDLRIRKSVDDREFFWLRIVSYSRS